MDYRSAYIRRSRKSLPLHKRLAAIGLLGAAGCATLYALATRAPASPAPARQVQLEAAGNAATPAPAVLRAAAQAETTKTRRVYPYSIVPGGVSDRRELARIVAMDQVVAAHYAAFETSRATIETVHKPRAVYVSYRKGDKVYWTAKKLRLAEGETLLSDGRNEIRTRCGNRISDVPQLPVEARGPSAEELDSSVEQADADEGEGDVEQTGFAVDDNPAGHGFQLRTFASAGTAPTRTVGMTRLAGGTPGVIWNGSGIPLYLVSTASVDTASVDTARTGTGSGAPGTGASGASGSGSDGSGSGAPGTGGSPTTGTSGTTPGSGSPSTGTQLPAQLAETAQPSTDPGTKEPSSIPGTLLPPTSDLPGNTNDPGKAPARQGNVPEPGNLWLGGAGVAALLAARRARRRPRG